MSAANPSWEILPPRERRQSNNKKRKLLHSATASNSCDDLDSSRNDNTEQSSFESQQQNIQDNIEKRSSQTRANKTTTLQSKDGCAGEFFECNTNYKEFKILNSYFKYHDYQTWIIPRMCNVMFGVNRWKKPFRLWRKILSLSP